MGGLLGHWCVWTSRAVELLQHCHRTSEPMDLFQLGVEITDANAAFFDAANGFRGCIDVWIQESACSHSVLLAIECRPGRADRGWIMKEGDMYRMWYTGFERDSSPLLKLGYATSADGFK